MSLNSDLQTLKTNIEGVKSTLYTNLTNKGVTSITESDTLSTLADKVSTITTGVSGGSGLDFSQIGYSDEFSAELNANMNADIAYSKSLLDAWNPNNPNSANGLYMGDTKLVYAPNIDTSTVTIMQRMFQNCIRLTSVPLYNTSKVKDMYEMFSNCRNLTTIPAFNTSNVTIMSQMFSRCSLLKKVPEMNTSKVTNFQNMFDNCTSLTTIEGISFKSFKKSTMNHQYLVGSGENSSIRKAVFKDIGYQSDAVQFNTSYITNWGVNTDDIPDARQSLIDSLITYSFDRASAGYPTCTITLSTNTKAILRPDEKAQIEAKGFTIA